MSDRPAPILADSLSGLDGVRHGFFTRRGGVSEGIYDSLNCGYGSADERAAVGENRRRVLATLGRDGGEIATAYQVHGTDVVDVETPWVHEARPRADAMVTRRRGVALGILTADCAPVLFADSEAGVAGAAHAGWRGAVQGVAEQTVIAMTRLGAEPERICAAVGPCIGASSYEVGPEFPEPFLAQDRDNADFFRPAPRPGHFFFDLEGYLLRRLRRLGLASVVAVGRDTCAEGREFFSYRRTCHEGGGDYGRNLSVILLED